MLKWRLITAVFLISFVLLGIFYLPLVGVKVILLLLFLGSSYEYAKLCALSRNFVLTFSLMTAMSFCLLIFLPVASLMLIKMVALGGIFWIVALILLFLFTQSNQTVWGWDALFGKSLIGLGMLLPAFVAMVLLIEKGPCWLLAGLCMIWAADSGAYFSGRAFGKHYLAKNISPKKTWEGVAGGLFLVLVVACLFYGFIPDIKATSFLMWIIIALAVTFFSIVGDLFESMLKRVAGVKDSGTLLPGHGGLLDRLDGMIAAMPIYCLLLGN